MIKEHEVIAVKFIEAIKNNGGLITNIEIDEKGLKELFDFSSDIIIIDGLAELGLIDLKRPSVFRLTDKGWNFKTFSLLRKQKIYKKIKKNISFILNVFFIIVTIALSILNFTISGKNKELTEKQLILEGELSRLDVQLNYLLKYQNRISLSDTIK